MPRSIAWLIRAAAVIALVFAARYLCYVPYQCNRMVLDISHSLEAMPTLREMEQLRIARRNIDLLHSTGTACSCDVNLHLLLAGNDRVLHDYDAARAEYTAALRVDERPEIYAERGMSELERGRVDAAIADLAAASRFNTSFAGSVDEGLRQRILAAAHRQ